MKILVTGGRSQLGHALIERLRSQYSSATIFVTARDPMQLNDFSDDCFVKCTLNLSVSPEVFYDSAFFKTIETVNFEVIYHCASPYDPTPLAAANQEQLLEHSMIIANQTLVLTHLAKRLTSNGCLIVVGAIGSERLYYHDTRLTSIGNVGSTSSHALHKGSLRDTVCCLFQEFPKSRIVHANISAFSNHVDEDAQQQRLTTAHVADRLFDLMRTEYWDHGYNIDILASDDVLKIQANQRRNSNMPIVTGAVLPGIATSRDKPKPIKRQKPGQLQPGTVRIHGNQLHVHGYPDLPSSFQTQLQQQLTAFNINIDDCLQESTLILPRAVNTAASTDTQSIAPIIGKTLADHSVRVNNREYVKSQRAQIAVASSAHCAFFQETSRILPSDALLSFEYIQTQAQTFANAITKKQSAIIAALNTYECHNVAEDEIIRSLDLLRNLEQNSTYFKQRVGRVATFLPANQPLYAMVCFGVVPTLMCHQITVRPPTVMQACFCALDKAIGFQTLFPNLQIAYIDKKTFVKQQSAVSDIVIFTGKAQNGLDIKSKFPKDTLFILNGAGHNPVVVTEGADIDAAVSSILRLCLQNQGQDCAAPNAILVHQSLQQAITDKIITELKALQNCVGTYSDPKHIIGPNSHPEHALTIAKLLAKNKHRVVYGGEVNAVTGLIRPALMVKPLTEGAQWQELFAPIIVIQPYGQDTQLARYFDSPTYQKHAMYVTVFGDSPYVMSLVENGWHTAESILHNTDLHRIERGFLPYGGLGEGASCIYYQGQVFKGATLPQRDIYRYKVLGLDHETPQFKYS